VGSAEGRQEIVECYFVRQIYHRYAGAPFVPVTVKNVVMTQGEVEQMTGLNALRIVVIILRFGLGQIEVERTQPGCAASRQRRAKRTGSGELSITGEACLEFRDRPSVAVPRPY
jgi:hypothetical protein